MGAKWGLDGFWVNPEGNLIWTSNDRGHAEIILELISEIPQEDADRFFESEGLSGAEMIIVDHGLQRGWIRVLEETDRELSVEYRDGLPNRASWSALHRFIHRDADPQLYVFSDPGSRSDQFYRKAEALRFVGAKLR